MAEESSWWESAWDYVTDTDDGLVSDVGGFFTDSKGNLDTKKITSIATTGATLADAFGLLPDTNRPTGYQGSIPKYTAVRAAVPESPQPASVEDYALMQQYQYDPNRRPGSSGRRYFSDVMYSAPDQVTSAREQAERQAEGLAMLNRANPARRTITPPEPNLANTEQTQAMARGGIAKLVGGGPTANAPQTPMSRQDLINLYESNPQEAFKMVMSGAVGGKPQSMSYARTYLEMLKKAQGMGQLPSQQQPAPKPPMPTGTATGMAQGGLAGLYGQQNPMFAKDKNKMRNQTKGYYLGGPTDGMADAVPAQIDNQQPAALSDGEFVIPADVVSHLGNGNSNAGAEQLYGMMERIRQARTGNAEQGKQINPNNFTPA
jgi:hypothetical protein